MTEEERLKFVDAWNDHGNELTFIFEDRDDAAAFKLWMSCSGEQQFEDPDDENWYSFDYSGGAVIKVTKSPKEE